MSEDLSEEIDFFPWSRDEEIEYELWALDQEEKRYNEAMAAIDADGGDVSHLLYPDQNNPIDTTVLEQPDPEQTIYP